jgi:hypothetical protein
MKRGVTLPEWIPFKDVLQVDELITSLGKIIQEKAIHDEKEYSVVYSMQGKTIWKYLSALAP